MIRRIVSVALDQPLFMLMLLVLFVFFENINRLLPANI